MRSLFQIPENADDLADGVGNKFWTDARAASKADALHGATHAAGGADPITIAISQVTGLSAAISDATTNLISKDGDSFNGSGAALGNLQTLSIREGGQVNLSNGTIDMGDTSGLIRFNHNGRISWYNGEDEIGYLTQGSLSGFNLQSVGSLNFAESTDIFLGLVSGLMTIGNQGFVSTATIDLTGATVDATGSTIVSPSFTGATATTPAVSDNSTKVATTAWCQARIADLIGTAPANLDTLQEIAAHLSAEETTTAGLVTAIATKAPTNAPSFTNGATVGSGSFVVTSGDITSSTYGKTLTITNAFHESVYCQFINSNGAGNTINVTLGVNSQGFRLKNRSIAFDATYTPAGTTGNRTINTSSGSVNVAAGQSSITVTNSLVAATTQIIACVATNDATAQIKNTVSSAGSFTINLSAAATAETKINWFFIN